MTLKSKFKIIVDGVLKPYIVFIFITFIFAFLFALFTKNDKPNSLLVQGSADILIFFALVPMYLSFKDKYNVRSQNFDQQICLYMIPLAFSLCIFCNILIEYLPTSEINQVTEAVIKLSEEYNVYLSLLIVAIIIPIIEELLFRGFFYDAICLISNEYFAIALSSAAFAIAHFDLRQSIYAFIAGLVMGYVRFCFKNIIYTIIMHLLMNITSLVFLPSITNETNKGFVLFISIGLFILTIYRINLKRKY